GRWYGVFCSALPSDEYYSTINPTIHGHRICNYICGTLASSYMRIQSHEEFTAECPLLLMVVSGGVVLGCMFIGLEGITLQRCASCTLMLGSFVLGSNQIGTKKYVNLTVTLKTLLDGLVSSKLVERSIALVQ
ncbi:septum site-determining protein MinD, partial [Striga asiatica]